jgi:hypothetical protein
MMVCQEWPIMESVMGLGIMGLLILVELWWFKKRGWFD